MQYFSVSDQVVLQFAGVSIGRKNSLKFVPRDLWELCLRFFAVKEWLLCFLLNLVKQIYMYYCSV